MTDNRYNPHGLQSIMGDFSTPWAARSVEQRAALLAQAAHITDRMRWYDEANEGWTHPGRQDARFGEVL